MEIPSYLCFGGIVWIIGLAFAMSARLRIGVYTAFSLFFALAGLALFELGSWWMRLVRLGEGYSLSLPQDYLDRGAMGVALLIVGIVGALSPLLAAWIVSRQSAKPSVA